MYVVLGDSAILDDGVLELSGGLLLFTGLRLSLAGTTTFIRREEGCDSPDAGFRPPGNRIILLLPPTWSTYLAFIRREDGFDLLEEVFLSPGDRATPSLGRR